MISFSVTIKNAPDFSRLKKELENPVQFMQDVSRLRRIAFYNQMATNRDASGNPVAPLNRDYATVKESKYGSRSIRVASGKMQSQYRSEILGSQLREYIESDLAPFHQYGTKNMPQRKLLPLSWDDMDPRERILIERASEKLMESLIQAIVNKR